MVLHFLQVLPALTVQTPFPLQVGWLGEADAIKHITVSISGREPGFSIKTHSSASTTNSWKVSYCTASYGSL